MLNDKEFNKVIKETVYYYIPDDIIIPLDGLPHKADLIEIGKNQFWIPHKVRKPIQLVNVHTGEIFVGYIVKRYFLNKDKNKPRRKNWLRKRTDLEYDKNGERIKLKDGWITYTPEVF